MAQEEEAIRGKEADETGNPLVPASSPPPKLNLRRLESIQRWLKYASWLVLVVVSALIVGSYLQLNKLYDQRKKIEDEIEKKRDELKGTQNRIDETNDKIARLEKGYLAQKNVIDSLPPEQKKDVVQKIENNPTQGNNSKQAPGWIYIQIAREDQRPRATSIASQLKNKGFIVPGIENVGNKAPNDSELRTCGKNDDPTNEDLENITATLKSSVTLNKPKFLSNCGKVDSRQYELWFGNDF